MQHIKKIDEQKIEYHCKKDGNYVLTVTKRVPKQGSNNGFDEVSTTFEKGLKYEIGRWNPPFESLSIAGKNISGDITADVDSFSLKSEFDKLKNGSYAIKITKEFKYFTTNKPFFNTISNDIQEITERP